MTLVETPADALAADAAGTPAHAARKHRLDVDGLRAVAILSVVLYHFKLPFITGGFTGVDIFFVISGFVISKSILSDIGNKTFSIGNFYFKRIRRVFPAYAMVMVLSLLAAFALLLPDDFGDFGRSLLSASLFCSNIYFWKSSGYFAASAHTKPLLHTWSLSVEEQFYIFAPIVIFAIHRYGGRRWLLFLLPVALLGLACSVLAVFTAPTAGFFLLPTRIWELLIGVLVAVKGWRASASRPVREAMAALGAALIAAAFFGLRDGDPFPGWFALMPCVGAGLIIQAGNKLSSHERPIVNRLLASPVPVWIGLISYSLYLVHWPVASLVRYQTLRDPRPAEIAVMLAASVLLSWVSWRYVEQPFRSIGFQHRAKVLWGGVLVVAVGAAAGGAISVAKGMPGRFPDFSQQAVSGVEDWGGGACFNQDPTRPIPWDATICTRAKGSKGRILLWGDSFAAQYMPGILRDSARIDADVMQYTFAGCPPILAYFSYARVGCSVSNQRVLSLISEQHVDTVVLSARWTDVPRRTLAKIPETVAALKALGVRVVVFGQSPEFAADVQHIDYISGVRMAPGGASWPVVFEPGYNDELAALSAGAVFIDPLRFLCQGEDCQYRQDQNYYYADYGHFSTAGAVRAVRAYFPAGHAGESGQP